MSKIDMTKAMDIIGFMLAQEFQSAAPKITSELARSFPGTMRVQGGKIYFSLPNYAEYVMDGSPPHVIEAKNKKSLAVPIDKWEGVTPNPYGSGEFPMLSKDGKFALLGKRVYHPGNAPNPFMKEVLHTKIKDIIKTALEQSVIN